MTIEGVGLKWGTFRFGSNRQLAQGGAQGGRKFFFASVISVKFKIVFSAMCNFSSSFFAGMLP